MPELGARQRAELPRSAFAYVDSKGRKRLPIHDESHVRNAMARFPQTVFEDEAARERARKRILTAARKFRIVPIGFFAQQLREERRHGEDAARRSETAALPTGVVTFLLADIEDSTGLLDRLSDGYPAVLRRVRTIIRTAVRRFDGREVDVRADEFFAAFGRAPAALQAAVDVQRALRDSAWPDGATVRVRIGVHTGRPTLTDAGYDGLSVNTTARVSSAGHGGQILVTAAVREAIDGRGPADIRLRGIGSYELRGLRQPQQLFQVEAADLPAEFPPLRSAAAVTAPGEAEGDAAPARSR